MIRIHGTRSVPLDTSKLPLTAVGDTVCPLVGGTVPSANLPGYVDDIVEFSSYSVFPTTGESGKFYLDTSNNKTYRWSGSTYVYITSGDVLSINNRKGTVILDKTDVSLGNVDNTADIAKNVASAGKLSTVRKINGVNFDGTADITVTANPNAHTHPISDVTDLQNQLTDITNRLTYLENIATMALMG
jgi:hypothetical protein